MKFNGDIFISNYKHSAYTVGCPAIPFGLRLRGFLGHGNFSAKIRTVPRKPGQLTTLLTTLVPGTGNTARSKTQRISLMELIV